MGDRVAGVSYAVAPLSCASLVGVLELESQFGVNFLLTIICGHWSHQNHSASYPHSYCGEWEKLRIGQSDD